MNLTVEFISVFILCGFLYIFFGEKIHALFQQCGYKTDEFYDCIFSSNKREIISLSTYSLIFFFLIVVLCKFFGEKYAEVKRLVLFLVILVSGVKLFTTNVIKNPTPTFRFIRIYVLSCLSSACFTACLFILWFRNFESPLCFSVMGIIPVTVPLFLTVGWLLEFPYTFIRNSLAIIKCKRKLNLKKEIIKIGVTGSFGKTTTKNFLYEMLKNKYSVVKTPASYNTPLGICKTVNKKDFDCEVFIAEMGARRKNDVKKLTKIVKPSIGIITGITCQHTKTLGGIEGVKYAKNQLIEGLVGEKYAVFSSDSSEAYSLYRKADCKKAVAGISGGAVWAEDIAQTKEGLEFTIIIEDEKFKTFCPLVGKHNVTDICISACVALYLGVSKTQILRTIPTLKSPPHRAQLINTETGLTVIDDGYNANLEGIRSLADAVREMDGYKVVVTCGVVELGKLEREENVKIGNALSEIFDLIICLGKNADFIIEGVENKDKTVKVKTLAEGSEIIKNKVKRGDVVCFTSDVPDRY